MTARNAVDGIQQCIASYANALSCADLTAETVQAVKVRVISEKFRGLTEQFLGAARANAILERLWALDTLRDIAPLPAGFSKD